MATRLTDVKINEVSFVDNPADPNARVEFFKRDESVDKGQPTSAQVMPSGSKKKKVTRRFRVNDEELLEDEEDMEKASRFFSAETRRGLASSGKAMPDGSFPIPDKDALRRAILSLGRTSPGKRGAVRAHIRRRAKALGAVDMLGESFAKEADMEKGFFHRLAERMGFDVEEGATLEDIDNAFVEQATMGEIEEMVGKMTSTTYSDGDTSTNDGGKMNDLDLTAVPADVVEHLEKTEKELEDAKARIEELEKSDEGDTTEEEQSDDDIIKGADPAVRELLEKAQAEAAEAQEIAKAEREARLNREFLEKADSLPHVGGERGEVASLLKELSEKVDAESFAKVEEILRAANEQISEGELFKTAGMTGAGTTGDAYAQIESLAKNLQESDANLSFEQAFDKVLEENPNLYTRYQEEVV